VAKRTPGFVGADLTALTKEAAAVAVMRAFRNLDADEEARLALLAATSAAIHGVADGVTDGDDGDGAGAADGDGDDGVGAGGAAEVMVVAVVEAGQVTVSAALFFFYFNAPHMRIYGTPHCHFQRKLEALGAGHLHLSVFRRSLLARGIESMLFRLDRNALP
jgi:SpoVK/Ycf46/Vps4 family AAA+-type ATPase